MWGSHSGCGGFAGRLVGPYGVYHDYLTNAVHGPKPVFRPSSPDDQPRIAEFLSRIFRVPLSHPTIRRDMMHWKYWQPGPAWDGSRSYVLERDGAILAHGAVWPIEMLPGTDNLTAVALIDWAADPASAGAGIALTTRIFQLAEAVIVIGGSEEALRMRAAMGFRPRNRIEMMARPLRPFRQIADDPKWTWKTPARLARNLAWSLWPLSEPSPGWTSVPADPASLLGHLAKCPAATSAFRHVLKDGRPAGWYFLIFVPGQARIAACALSTPFENQWLPLYRLAIEDAGASNEIIALASNTRQHDALAACGFRMRRTEQILVYDPRGRIPADAHLELQLMHSDDAFAHGETPSYLT